MTARPRPTIGAVDNGGTKIAVGIVNHEGRVLTSEECATEHQRGFVSAVDRSIGAAHARHHRFLEKGAGVCH
jgi:hypothetical protein